MLGPPSPLSGASWVSRPSPLPTSRDSKPSALSTRAILDACATVTLLVNRSGTIEFESAELARLTGWSHKAVLANHASRCSGSMRPSVLIPLSI